MRRPKLRKHAASGQWFVHWGGRSRYLGKDLGTAKDRYAEELRKRDIWIQTKRHERDRVDTSLRVVELAEKFLHSRLTEISVGCERTYRSRLKRFIAFYGHLRVRHIRASVLQEYKLLLIDAGLAPRTVNHRITAVKVMFNWASGLEIIDPVNFRGIKSVPVGAAHDYTIDADRLRLRIRTAPEKIRPWLALGYLALLRPSEVVRVVNGHGRFIEPGVFVLDKGKMDARSPLKRHCILSDQALAWLACAQPHWRSQASYANACRRARSPRAKAIQKSAAQHLASVHSADPLDIERLLGHIGGRMSVTYWRPSWQRLRQVSGRLSLMPFLPPPESPAVAC